MVFAIWGLVMMVKNRTFVGKKNSNDSKGSNY